MNSKESPITTHKERERERERERCVRERERERERGIERELIFVSGKSHSKIGRAHV